MPGLTLRPLMQNDLDRVAEIESRIVGHQRRGFLEKRFAAVAAGTESFITSAAVQDGNLVGYAVARLQDGEFGTSGPAAVLDIIGVDPDFQGKGLGTAVMADIEHQSKTKGIAAVRTQIDWADHGMTRFFASAGFSLASGRVIERDTSPLSEDVVRAAPNAGPEADWVMLERDRVFIRSLGEDDMAAVVRIDRKLTGQDRSAYYAAKFREVLDESGVRVSLAVVEDGFVTGFIMARVDFGEFGKVERTAVIDTIGVHPGFRRSGVGHALLSQLLVNLAALQVETVQTQVSWEHTDLQRFFQTRGFWPTQMLVLTKAPH